jgi:uncharacterized membrane protein YdjX (TVP38/TMEM64 family)
MADAPPTEPRRKALPRILVLLVLLAIVAVVLYVIFYTPLGQRFRDDPEQLRGDFRRWVETHRLIAPAGFILLFVVASLCLLPVWWLQILAGYGFGLWLGLGWSLIGATLAACASYLVSRTLLADYFHRKFEARHAKLRELDEKMGHNGLMIVMAARLMHFLPFGVSNYLFGITRINLVEVAIGTALGNIPGIALYVGLGTGLRPRHDWWFLVAIAGTNVLLLVPIVLRYLKPEWFKKIGVE